MDLLIQALDLTDADAIQFAAAARWQGAPGEVATATPRLPLPTSSLIGRAADVALGVERIAHQGVRLLTLVGPGGVGKTRLALAIAAALAPRFGGGIFFVDCSGTEQPEAVWYDIARALELREEGGRSLAQSLAAWTHTGDVLLILDNFEQVVAVAPQIAAFLKDDPRLTAIVTSRIPLRTARESVQTVAPLPIPDVRRAHPAEIAANPAVALFVARAQAARSDFTLTATNQGAVARLCARLSGIPLAIELAAPHVRTISPHDVLRQLTRPGGFAQLGAVAGRGEGRPRRQQSLEDVFAWSYRLLDAPTQILFRRLCVFGGEFDLEAVIGVCDPQQSLALDHAEAVALLVEHNLVMALPTTAAQLPPRFALLEVIRAFGQQMLLRRDEWLTMRRQHAIYYAAHLTRLEAALAGAEQQSALEQYARDYDNIVLALRWAREQAAAEIGLRLVAPLWWYWEKRRNVMEGREWLEGMLALYQPNRDSVDAHTMSRALYGAAILANMQGDLAGAYRLGERCLEWCQRDGNAEHIAQAYMLLGSIHKGQGETDAALAAFSAARLHLRSVDVPRIEVILLNNLSTIAIERGQLAEAADLLNESLAVKRRLGDQHSIAITLINLSEVFKQQGDYVEAMAAVREASDIFAALDDQMGQAMAFNNLGEIALEQGDATTALDHLQRGLALFQKSDNRLGSAMVWSTIGDAHRTLGQMGAAVDAWRTALELAPNGPQAAHCRDEVARAS